MDSYQFSAVEYFDPIGTLMQPNCDLKSIVSKLETEFASSFRMIKSNAIKGSQSDWKLHDKTKESVNESINSSSQLVEKFNCKCWSSRVEFVPNSSIYKLERKELSVGDMSNSDQSWTTIKQEHLVSPNLSDQASQKSSVQPRSPNPTRQNETIGSYNVLTNDTSLNSFTKFLRFFHQVHYCTSLSPKQLDSSTNKVELLSTSGDVKPDTDETCNSTTPKTNDLLEAIIHYPELYHILKDWNLYQDAQSLLGSVCTAALLVGNRVQVYRTSGTTQWYTAVIISYDERTNLMTLIDDTVLEQHQEDPTLLEMHLIDGGLIQSIIEGDDATSNVGLTRRRTQRSNQRQAAQTAQLAIMNSSNVGANNGLISAGSTTTIIKQPTKSLCLPAVSPAPSVASSSSSSAFSMHQQHMPTDAIEQSQSSIDNRINSKSAGLIRQYNSKVGSRAKRKRLAQTSAHSEETGKRLYICRDENL